jgi:hypothetical protein
MGVLELTSVMGDVSSTTGAILVMVGCPSNRPLHLRRSGVKDIGRVGKNATEMLEI